MIQEKLERLQAINTIATTSMTALNLVNRLHRLIVNAYRYRESNWIDGQLYGLRYQNNTPSAILVLNDHESELPVDLDCL